MNNLSQRFTADQESEAETALLSAVQIARDEWSTATPDQKTHLGERYKAALRALNAYMQCESHAARSFR
jgi:hypothetical protein